MKIKGNEVTRKDETTAVVDIFGIECKVHMRTFFMGGNTVEPLSAENPNITMGICIEYPNGEYELINKKIKTTAGKLGVLSFEGDELRKWFVAEVCGEHIVEVEDVL